MRIAQKYARAMDLSRERYPRILLRYVRISTDLPTGLNFQINSVSEIGPRHGRFSVVISSGRAVHGKIRLPGAGASAEEIPEIIELFSLSKKIFEYIEIAK